VAAGFSLAEAYVELSTRGFSGVMGSIHGVTNGFRGAIGVATSLQGKLALLGVTAGAGGILKLAADAETAEVQFEVLLKSATKARDLIGEIDQFAAKTPFEKMEITSATRKLLAFGSAETEVMGQLRSIGDIAALTGNPISELAEMYGKAQVQGRLFAEDINQLTGRGIPIIQELAKQFGVTDGEVRKLVESGHVTATNLAIAFESMTSDGGQFAGGMERLSQTTAGRFSTMVDNIKLSLTEMGEPLLPAAGKMIDVLSDLAANSVQIVAPAFDAIGSYIGTTLDGIDFDIDATTLAEIGTTIADVTMGVIHFGESVVEFVSPVAEIAIGIAKSFGGMLAGLDLGPLIEFGGPITAIIAGLSMLAAPSATVISGIVAIVAAIQWLGSQDEVVDKLRAVIESSFQAITEIWNTAIEVAEGLMLAAGMMWEELGGASASASGDMVGKVIGSILDWFKEITDAIGFIARHFETFLQMGIEKGMIFAANIVETFVWIAENTVASIQWLGDNWYEILTDMGSYTGTVLTNIGANLGRFYEAIKSWISGDGFNFDFKGLSEGFESSLKEMPKTVDLKLTDDSDKLKQLRQQMHDDELRHLEEVARRKQKTAKDVPEQEKKAANEESKLPAGNANKPKGKDNDKSKDKDGTESFESFYKSIVGSKDPQIEEQRKTNEKLDLANQKLSEIKTEVIVDSVEPAPAPVQEPINLTPLGLPDAEPDGISTHHERPKRNSPYGSFSRELPPELAAQLAESQHAKARMEYEAPRRASAYNGIEVSKQIADSIAALKKQFPDSRAVTSLGNMDEIVKYAAANRRFEERVGSDRANDRFETTERYFTDSKQESFYSVPARDASAEDVQGAAARSMERQLQSLDNDIQKQNEALGKSEEHLDEIRQQFARGIKTKPEAAVLG
jgi:tape measure domain-containing protein